MGGTTLGDNGSALGTVNDVPSNGNLYISKQYFPVDTTIRANTSAMAPGPQTIPDGVTVAIEDGAVLVIV